MGMVSTNAVNLNQTQPEHRCNLIGQSLVLQTYDFIVKSGSLPNVLIVRNFYCFYFIFV